jgi:hypothetical protein
MLGKLVEALRPSPFDQLQESTLNAGLATLYSMKPQSELEALLAVQIIATGFSRETTVTYSSNPARRTSFLRWDCPEPNRSATDLSTRYGLYHVVETARMYRGHVPDLSLARTYGITTFELG